MTSYLEVLVSKCLEMSISWGYVSSLRNRPLCHLSMASFYINYHSWECI